MPPPSLLEPPSQQACSANVGQQQTRLSVLVVNDEPGQLEVLEEVLRDAGFCVLTAADGDEGYRVAKLEHPDLVISDVTMPSVSGIQLCRLIRSDEALKTTPVLLTSGLRKDDTTVLEGFGAGADDYLEMPINPLRLVAQAARLIERRKTEEALRDLSLTDELTMLRNRRGFITLCRQYLELVRTRRTGTVLLVYADIDELKHINDRFGHQEGSRAIVQAAQILRKSCRDSDIVGRIGGDEFTVLAIGADTADEITARIEGQLQIHNAEGKRPYQLSLSVGVTRIEPGSTATIEDLLARADRAMYEHKKAKKARR